MQRIFASSIFHKISLINSCETNVYSADAVACGGQEMNTLLRYSTQTRLVPIRNPRRMKSLVACEEKPVRKIQTRDLEWSESDSRRLLQLRYYTPTAI